MHLPALLSDLESAELVSEIIVVDGGSTDATLEIAKQHNVLLLNSPRGRAVQMNAGAKSAQNEILLFIHADSRIDPANINAIPDALSDAVAGSFYLVFDRKHWLLNFYSGMSRLNYSYFTYGDQGLFLSKQVFENINGFKQIAIMEDLDIISRLKQKGRFTKLKYPLVSSSRRFIKHGMLSQQLRNILLVGLFSIGFKPAFLSRFYSYKNQ